MRTRQRAGRTVSNADAVAPRIAEGVEGIFYNIVPGRSGDMQEELTTEFGQTKTGADFAAVEDDSAFRRPDAFAPLGENRAISGKQRHPAGERARAVTRPVIRGNKPRMRSFGIAEKNKVGGEI